MVPIAVIKKVALLPWLATTLVGCCVIHGGTSTASLAPTFVLPARFVMTTEYHPASLVCTTSLV